MKKALKAALAAAPLASLTLTGALAHTVEKNNIQIIHPWIEAPGCTDAAAFPTIANEGLETISLVGIETPVADRVEISKDGRALDNIEIPGGEVLSFDGERLAVILKGLKESLVEGRQVPATFSFANGETVELHMVIGNSEPMPDLVPQQPQVQLAQTPISLILFSDSAAEFAPPMAVSSGFSLPRGELSFDVGLY